LAYSFKTGLRRAVLLSFLLSLFFELTQLTGLFFLYLRPYRLFDVNDLMLNTLGGVCGYFLYTRFLKGLPNTREIDARSLERSRRVGFTRRLVALLVDSLLVSAIGALLARVIGLDDLWLYGAVFFVYYPAFALALRGGTPGKLLVKIRIEGIDESVSPRPAICFRYVARNAFLLVNHFTPFLLSHIAPRHRTLFIGVLFLAVALACFDWLFSFRRDKRLWYERLSKTKNTSYFARGRDHVQHIDP
jgi:hypothetical protein